MFKALEKKMDITKNITKHIKNICNHLGENNKPVYVAMLIAAVKGICRPTFTMMDKTEKPETKKYTAIREGLTELIAIPTYFLFDQLACCVSRLIKDESKSHRAKHNLGFISVCASAVFIIPALCSATIKPVMDKLHIKSPENAHVKPTPMITSNLMHQRGIRKPSYQVNSMGAFISRPSSGLKVGGL